MEWTPHNITRLVEYRLMRLQHVGECWYKDLRHERLGSGYQWDGYRNVGWWAP